MNDMDIREARLADIKAFIVNRVDGTIKQEDLAPLNQLPDQTLHLLAAAIDNI